MALMVAILAWISNKPTGEWNVKMGNLDLTPNTLISIFTTVGKMALMVPVASCISQLKWSHFIKSPHSLHLLQELDDASRGPWGASKRLVRFIRRKPHLATTWGLCFLTVAGLAMEPTAQNVLDQVTREILMPNVRSKIAGANSAYTSRAYPDVMQTFQNSYWPSINLLRFQSSTIDAVINGAAHVQFSCASPASRCTWPSFTTLGVCSTYRNITELVTHKCEENRGATVCSYYGIPDQKDPMTMVFGGDLGGNGDQGISTRCSGSGSLATCTILKAPHVWEFISRPRTSPDSGPRPDPDKPKPVEVLQISWYWCSQTHTNVSAGAGGVHDEAKGNMRTEELKPSSLGPYAYTTKDDQTRYDVPSIVSTGLVNQVLGMFGDLEFFSKHPNQPAWPGVDLAYQFLATDNVGELAQRVADSFTTRIRNVDGPTADNHNATWIEGDAFGAETYFDVRWPYLILPLFETMLAGLLLGVTIRVTRSEPLLKTSVLAFLLHPLAGWTEEEMRPPQLYHEAMKKMAKEMHGQLAYDGMGSAIFMKTK
ncbi:hypothetical protein PG989_011999 [Apiospora arundinis]